MLRNKKFQLIISLLIAIALWLYVVGDINPSISADISDIQVEMTGEDTLEEMGMEATLNEPQRINITINGPRSDVNEAKASDIKAVVDVSNCEYGENTEPIKIVFPDDIRGITVVSLSKEEASFTVE